MQRGDAGGAGIPAQIVRGGSDYSPGPLQGMSAGLAYVVQSLTVRPSGHSFGRVGSAAALSAALPASVELSHSSGVTWTVVEAGFLPSRICRASATPAPPTAAGFVTAAPFRSGMLRSWLTKPALSAPTIGTWVWLAVFSASTIDASTPDVQIPSNFVP